MSYKIWLGRGHTGTSVLREDEELRGDFPRKCEKQTLAVSTQDASTEWVPRLEGTQAKADGGCHGKK